MTKLLNFLPGPELYWLLATLGASQLARANRTAGRLDYWIEQCAYLAPLLALGSFVFYLLPNTPKTGLWIRIWIAGIVGGHYFLETALQGYSTQGAGIGTAYLAGMIYACIALSVGSVWVAYRVFINPG